MATMGRPKAALFLSDPERDEFVRMLRQRSTPQTLALRARIVPRCERVEPVAEAFHPSHPA